MLCIWLVRKCNYLFFHFQSQDQNGEALNMKISIIFPKEVMLAQIATAENRIIKESSLCRTGRVTVQLVVDTVLISL